MTQIFMMWGVPMKKFLALAASAAATLAVCAPANAALVNLNYVLDANNFNLAFGNGSAAPMQPVHLDVTLSFDDGASFSNATSGMTVNSFSLPYGLQYAYDASSKFLTIATDAGAGSCGNPANSFCSFWNNGNSLSASPIFVQQETSTSGYWTSSQYNATVSTAAVPEPASWAMMIGGFVLAGAAMRSRKAALRFA